MFVRKRLALEYNGSSGAVCVVEWGYFEAHSFSNEADWYINAITRIYWFSVHGHFSVVNSISGFTNSHNDSLFVIVDGYSLFILIPDNFSIERFSKSTDRNHSSPCTVNIWGSIHGEELLVNNILGRTDGHGYFMMCNSETIASGVLESSRIDTIVRCILDNNNDVCFSIFGSIYADLTFAIFYLTIIKSLNGYDSIFVALIVNESAYDLTVYLCSLAIFFNNRNSYIIVFVSRPFHWIKFEAHIVVRINDGVFSGSTSSAVLCISFYSYKSTEQRFISCDILFGVES